MISTTIDVETYATAVRTALAGLGPDQVEDLTDGLEANLSEALADEGSGRSAQAVFGPPAEYAAELLSAAGLDAPRSVQRRRRTVGELLDAPFQLATRRGRSVLVGLRAQRWWPPVEEFVVALRPAWWVLRAWLLWRVLADIHAGSGSTPVLPRSALGSAVLILLLVGSVQWGRGRWRTQGVWHRAALAVSAVAVLAILPEAVFAAQSPDRFVAVSAYVPADGVVVQGERASNLFVYDADGNPVDHAQIYDQAGRPVVTAGGDGYAVGPQDGVVPFAVAGEERWNVFPMAPAIQPTTEPGGSAALLPSGRTAAQWPFAKAPALTGPAASPSASIPGAFSTPGASSMP